MLNRLADLFEMREECLREFEFMNAYKLDKSRENKALAYLICFPI